ncbi:MAG TPA: hypothetical protein VKE70_11960 [Candidatus Solibacter sp.]|nr:hypothetical protein [Candidatus Solibacter sp.]
MLRSCWLLAAFAVCLPLSAANVCISGNTLDTYQALGSTGCTIGGLTVKDFDFQVVSSGGGATPIANTDVNVILHFPLGGFGLEFQSNGFAVTATQFVNYLIAFTWDPTGDMRNASDILDPGTSDILTDLCIGAPFVGVTCAGSTHTLHVFQGGGPSQLTDSFAFAPQAILGVRNNIALTSSGSFNSIENDVFIPEPVPAILGAAGLVALLALRRRLGASA